MLRVSQMIGFGNAVFSPLSLFAGGSEGVWYDPSVASSVWEDTDGTDPAVAGDLVARIDDLSGNGHNSFQATSSARPILRNPSGNIWYLEFDGTDDNLGTAGNPFTDPITTAWAGMGFREVARTRSVPWSLTGDTDTGGRYQSHMPWDSGVIYFDIKTFDSPDRISAATTVSIGTDAVFTFGSSDAVNTQFIRIDGVELVSDATGSSVSGGSRVFIGGRNSSTAKTDGRFYSFIAVSPILSAVDQVLAETYLSASFGGTL